MGRVFSWDEWTELQPALSDFKALPKPNGSLFIGNKGMLTTGTYGDSTRLLPIEKMKNYSFPPELLTRSPGHCGDPACSNFDIAAALHRMGPARCNRPARPRQARVGQRQDALHQQSRSQPLPQAHSPQRLVDRVTPLMRAGWQPMVEWHSAWAAFTKWHCALMRAAARLIGSPAPKRTH
jgi:hypothetical protein